MIDPPVSDEERERLQALAVFDRAAAALGTDLGGWSAVDLLCDNMPVSVARARELATWVADFRIATNTACPRLRERMQP